jgi:endo-1,4-beta-xylanase
LVWHSRLPDWVEEGNFTKKELIEVMHDHIKALAGHYKGRCTRWDVVNEGMIGLLTACDHSIDMINSPQRRWHIPRICVVQHYWRRISSSSVQIRIASRSEAQLFYNDYNLEYNGTKTDGAQQIVKLIQKAGVKINGVGFQAHLASDSTPTSPGAAPGQQVLSAALRKMTSQGVDVAYTEINVRMNIPPTKEKI